MQKLQDYWGERNSQQKIVLVAAFLVTFIAVGAFAWLAQRPSLSLLYGGIDTARAGEVIAGVERAGVPYEVRGDSIWVESSARDRLRMELAAQGLPGGGGAGYELLDGMSGFGTTSQMFDAAYWRAKEGELARTILALPNVKSARVHLAVDNSRGYRRDSGGSASVTLTTNGAPITSDQAAALRHLLASGVPGMLPQNVAVINSVRGMIATDEGKTGGERADEMKRNVERILEPHVGSGNAIVELNLDVISETELMTEQRFDPQQRALISQVTEETSDQSNSSGSGAVTAASNLPDNQGANGDQTQSARTENRQQANYEVSTITREVSRQPGDTRRLTVAVLVNGVAQIDAQGETQIVPRAEAELQVLRELVASTVGFDAARGDEITVKSLPFAALGEAGTSAAPGLLDRLELNSLLRLVLIGLFAVAIALIVLRPLLRRRNPAQIAGPSGADAALDDSRPPATVLTGAIEPEESGNGLDSRLISPSPMRDETPQQLSLPPADPVARLRSMMRDRQDETVKILSGWIDNKESAS